MHNYNMTELLKFRISKFFTQSYRFKGSLGLWDQDINSELKIKIEKHWSKSVSSDYSVDSNGRSFYVLPMFPYPSGNLHMGHVRVYSISDTLARFHKLNGKNVIHPIGWDAFGLPAENAAIERNILPHDWTKSNINTMKEQILQLGFKFDWDREFATCDPNYYKWTQYIFRKLYDSGLAYQDKALVNWDPIDKTVLADEQVDDLGCSWRSGAKVEKKVLIQWFIKTSKYAKKLYDGLHSDYLENWKDIINLQKHWIGKCNGIVVSLKFTFGTTSRNLDVWSEEPHKFKYAQFLTIKPTNIFVQELKNTNNANIKCFNPITNRELPVYVTNDVNYAEGRDIYLASPLIDIQDRKFAESLAISCPDTNNDVDVNKESEEVITLANSKNIGGYFVSSKLKDWLISRQRYWGTPIPIIHCDKCGTVPVPYEDLPVTLPLIDSRKPNINTLIETGWVYCTCPNCNSKAMRETDTMDTFVDSSWYYYRFLDPNNKKVPFSKEKVCGNTPVDIYIGGKEHAVLHLYYARFMSYFLHSLGYTETEEPFKKLVVQGMVMGQSYCVKSSGKYIPEEQVEKDGEVYKEKGTGEPLSVQWEKMSKSKYNGVNPSQLLSKYGCDTTKLLMLADVPPATSRHWSDATLPGVLNWQHRLWITIKEFQKHRSNDALYCKDILTPEEFNKHEEKIRDSRNYLTATTTYHFKYTHKLSVGISRLQSLTTTLRNNVPAEVIAKSKEFELALASLIIMLSPITPHFCSELWAGFRETPNRITDNSSLINWDNDVLGQKWPVVDEDYELSFLCKVDGADRCNLRIKANELKNLTAETALNIVLNEESVIKRIQRGISKTKFELYPDARAIMHIFTNRKVKKQQEEPKETLSRSNA